MFGVNVFVLFGLICKIPSMSGESVSIPTSCTDLEDGDYILKLIDDDSYPLISVQCSNGYAMIDFNKDNNWNEYLSSWRDYYFVVSGPSKDDHVNWKQWLTVTNDDSVESSFIVSPSCDVCDESGDMQIADTAMQSSYYMLSSGTDCVRRSLATQMCDVSPSTYQCRVCESDPVNAMYTGTPFYNGIHWDSDDDVTLLQQNDYDWDTTDFTIGSCPFLVFESTQTILQSSEFAQCMDVSTSVPSTALKPSLGTEGQFCQCFKTSESTSYIQVSEDAVSDKVASLMSVDSDTDANSVYYLYSSDFTDGTYIITESGTYVIMEDITFDFKAGISDINQVSISADATEPAMQYSSLDWWWPTEDDSDRYEGAGGYMGPYHLGFWAGITIECSDVTLDLNGHTLAMSLPLYYQQSFFANVALVTQSFLPWQGVGPMGAHPNSAKNVVVKNGVLGLTSHFGIFGFYNEGVLIEDLVIRDFKTHGIELSGFSDVTIRNTEIGPSFNVEKTSVYYSHMRHLLPTFTAMANDPLNDDICVTFSGRDSCVTMSDLVSDVTTMLDMAFEYAVFDKDWDLILDTLDDDVAQLWRANKDAFINVDGYPTTATLYGLFLNYPGSNVIKWYTNNDKSNGATIENVYIHDLWHSSEEAVVIEANSQMALNSMGNPIHAEHVYGKGIIERYNFDPHYNIAVDLEYVGNLITDITVLQYELVTNYGLSWYYFNTVASGLGKLRDFAIDGDISAVVGEPPILTVSGGQDKQIHPGKGILGMRINGVEDVTIDGLTIENLKSETNLGNELCLSSPTYQSPYISNYQLNHVEAITITYSTIASMDNVKIDNLESETGATFGIMLWFCTDVIQSIGTHLSITNMIAGSQVDKGTLTYNSGDINLAPESCAIRIYDAEKTNVADVIPNTDASLQWKISNLDGNVACGGSHDIYSNIGIVTTETHKIDRSSSLPNLVWLSMIGAMIVICGFVMWRYRLLPVDVVSKDGKQWSARQISELAPLLTLSNSE